MLCRALPVFAAYRQSTGKVPETVRQTTPPKFVVLDSWPAAIFTQFSTSDSYQQFYVSLRQTHYCKDSPFARRMSLHHGLTDLCGSHFTDSFILAWFQASSQASLRFCLWAPLTSKRNVHEPDSATLEPPA